MTINPVVLILGLIAMLGTAGMLLVLYLDRKTRQERDRERAAGTGPSSLQP